MAVMFAEELLRLWVGPHIAAHGAPVMQWLAIGVWINILAQVPLTALQASGRAHIVGSVQLLELPLYAALAWWLILRYGTTGAAAAWAIRAVIEWLALSFALHRAEAHPGRWPGISPVRLALLSATIIAAGLTACATPVAVKCLLALVLMLGLTLWQWRHLLTAQERGKLLARISRRAAAK
jgi:O-antigen/teichoic acid export membrane protein